MDETRLEQMVREALDVEMPEGMRGRVLGAAVPALRRSRRPHRRPILRHFLAWAAAGFVLVSVGVDGLRQERLALMTLPGASSVTNAAPGLAELRRRTERLLVQLESADTVEGRKKERG